MKLTLGPPSLTTELEFTISKPRVGIYMSGGMDSAALLCLVLSELANDISVPVTCFTVTKNDKSISYAPRLVQKIADHFCRDILHVTDVINNDHAINEGYIGTAAMHRIMLDYPDAVYYMGLNRMPTHDIHPFTHKLKIVYGDDCRESPAFSSPFLTMHKPQLIDLFYKLGCENIIPYTKSCTVHEVGTCNNCYSCEERAWGFSALGKPDPGTIPL